MSPYKSDALTSRATPVRILAGRLGLEPRSMVLETTTLTAVLSAYEIGQHDRICTCGLSVPNRAHYWAVLHADDFSGHTGADNRREGTTHWS